SVIRPIMHPNRPRFVASCLPSCMGLASHRSRSRRLAYGKPLAEKPILKPSRTLAAGACRSVTESHTANLPGKTDWLVQPMPPRGALWHQALIVPQPVNEIQAPAQGIHV